jgi:hypothetical protein
VVLNAPHRGVIAEQRAKAGRGDTLRMLEGGHADPAGAKPSVPPQDRSAKPDVKPATREEPPADDVPGDGDGGEPDGHRAPDPAAAAEDPAVAKRLATIQAAETRQREKATKARAELETRAKAIETEWAPRVAKAEHFEALQAKARKGGVHLVDAFRALGFGDDDLEPAAQTLYAHSKAGAADPARKQQAERAMRERELADRGDETQKRIDALEAKLAAKDKQTQFQELQGQYLDSALDAITEAAPIARAATAAIDKARAEGTAAGKAQAAKLATKLRAKLWELTVAMTAELDGDAPDPADVIARYEESRGAELDELGIPRPTSTTTSKPNNKPADKQHPARTLSNDLSTSRVPRPAQSGDVARKESRRDTLRALETGKLD